MKRIFLTQGKIALVDDDDYERLNQHKWYYRSGYAARRDPDGSGELIRMHREIMNASSDEEVDHINNESSKTDNRKSNLRVCSKAENLRNRGKTRNNTSGYKGVSFVKASNKWMAQIQIDGKNQYLGLFEDKIEAAKAYDRAAIALHKEFAELNVYESGTAGVTKESNTTNATVYIYDKYDDIAKSIFKKRDSAKNKVMPRTEEVAELIRSEVRNTFINVTTIIESSALSSDDKKSLLSKIRELEELR